MAIAQLWCVAAKGAGAPGGRSAPASFRPRGRYVHVHLPVNVGAVAGWLKSAGGFAIATGGLGPGPGQAVGVSGAGIGLRMHMASAGASARWICDCPLEAEAGVMPAPRRLRVGPPLWLNVAIMAAYK